MKMLITSGGYEFMSTFFAGSDYICKPRQQPDSLLFEKTVGQTQPCT